MSNDIKAGDLVYVVKTPCCGSGDHTNTPPFVVTVIRTVDDVTRGGSVSCMHCKFLLDKLSLLARKPNGRYIWLSILRKFRDFPESELRDETRELEAQS